MHLSIWVKTLIKDTHCSHLMGCSCKMDNWETARGCQTLNITRIYMIDNLGDTLECHIPNQGYLWLLADVYYMSECKKRRGKTTQFLMSPLWLVSSSAPGPVGRRKPRMFASAGEGAHPAVPQLPVPTSAWKLQAALWVRQPTGRSQLWPQHGDLCWTQEQLGRL